MTDHRVMKGSEFRRLIEALGRRRGIAVRIVAERGKGSHKTIYYGAAHTTLQHEQHDLKPKTLHTMLSDLGLTKKDLQ
jgi:mRNA interferase HicA